MKLRRHRLELHALVIALPCVAACSRPDDVEVRLSRVERAGSAIIDGLTVFSGADKRSIELSPGETERVLLRPDGERPDVVLTFRLNGAPRSWEGPPLAKGTEYAVDLVVEDDGTITEAHCAMPCELP